MSTAAELLTNREYKYGFVTDIETETIAKGLSEDTVRLISSKKNEPEWMLEFRLKAYRQWLKMTQPDNWANFDYPNIDFQNISYYSAPKEKAKKASLDEVDPELIKTFEKLGIPITEQKMLANVAVDAVFDSVSVATTSSVCTAFGCWMRAASRASSRNMDMKSGSFANCGCRHLMATVRENPTGPRSRPKWTVAMPPAAMTPWSS